MASLSTDLYGRWAAHCWSSRKGYQWDYLCIWSDWVRQNLHNDWRDRVLCWSRPDTTSYISTIFYIETEGKSWNHRETLTCTYLSIQRIDTGDFAKVHRDPMLLSCPFKPIVLLYSCVLAVIAVPKRSLACPWFWINSGNSLLPGDTQRDWVWPSGCQARQSRHWKRSAKSTSLRAGRRVPLHA